MFSKNKEITRNQLKGVVHQLRYLIEVKKVSDERLEIELSNILKGLGVKTQYVPSIPPWC